MGKAKPVHVRNYWKYHSAMLTFEKAGDLIKRLKDFSNQDALYYPLMIALHVLYARPFKQRNENRNIEESMIPTDLISVHNLNLQLRDKIFAHHDKKSNITYQDSGHDLSQLVIRVQNGIITPAMQIIYPNERQLSNTLRLCETLYEKCKEKGLEAINHCISEFPSEDGIYIISTDFDGDSPFFTKAEVITKDGIQFVQ